MKGDPMSSARSSAKQKRVVKASSLMVRLDPASKEALTKAARLRRVSISDYVRMVTIEQARHEISAAEEQTLVLSPVEQLAFWKALNDSPRLTPAQKRLSKVMRG